MVWPRATSTRAMCWACPGRSDVPRSSSVGRSMRGGQGPIASNQARLAPLTLKTSAEMRLQRLARGAILKYDSQQLVVPIKRGAEPAEFLVAFLRELLPQQ